MLDTLIIDNFTIINHVEMNFHRGLSTITGETGAGKSIIIEAISQLAGTKSSRDLIRKGANKAVIFAEFSHLSRPEISQLLATNDIDFDGDYLSIQKEIKTNGRSIARVNGSVVNGSFLKTLGSNLFNIEEQTKHQRLLTNDDQRELLDSFAGSQLKQKLAQYQSAFNKYKKKRIQVASIKKKNQDLKERLDYLKFANQEISEINPRLNEDQDLETKRVKLSNYEKISNALQQIQDLIVQDQGIQDLLGKAQQISSDISNYGSDYKKIFDDLNSAGYALSDALAAASNASDDFDLGNENELDLVLDRLNSLDQLKKKYGGDLASVLTYQKKAQAEIEFSQNSADSLKKLEDKSQYYYELAQNLANELTRLRKTAASKLIQLIEKELVTLGFQNPHFEIKFINQDLQESGQDQITYFVQTNVGEPIAPLANIASGGELSRILLALKAIFAQFLNQVIFIFDEIDTGVSGHAAQAMADKIYQIAQTNQVISITHLPQLAAMSDHQYLIKKNIVNGRTASSICLLNEKEQIEAIAQMLTGTKMTEVTKLHAQEMVKLAQKAKIKDGKINSD